MHSKGLKKLMIDRQRSTVTEEEIKNFAYKITKPSLQQDGNKNTGHFFSLCNYLLKCDSVFIFLMFYNF